MATTDSIRQLLTAGRRDDLVAELTSLDPAARRAVCRPLARQANAILSAQYGSTVKTFLRDLREDYPGGHEQFVGAWTGVLRNNHWDSATTILLAAKDPARAAKVWPLPQDRAFAQAVIPALFPDDLDVFVERWSEDFATNPKNWDRNHGREVMYEWIEAGFVEAPRHDGAVLMVFSYLTASPGRPLLRWLLARPKVTSELFTRIFTTPGVSGASLAQSDYSDDRPIRTVVVPGLMKAGVWSRDFVVEGTRSALSADLPAYQRRWFLGLADELGL